MRFQLADAKLPRSWTLGGPDEPSFKCRRRRTRHTRVWTRWPPPAAASDATPGRAPGIGCGFGGQHDYEVQAGLDGSHVHRANKPPRLRLDKSAPPWKLEPVPAGPPGKAKSKSLFVHGRRRRIGSGHRRRKQAEAAPMPRSGREPPCLPCRAAPPCPARSGPAAPPWQNDDGQAAAVSCPSPPACSLGSAAAQALTNYEYLTRTWRGQGARLRWPGRRTP